MPSYTTDAFLVHSIPEKEADYICHLFTRHAGLVKCRLMKRSPEPYRPFELKLIEKDGFFTASDFRYIDALLIVENNARLLGLYVNELIYRMLPHVVPEPALYGGYMSTLLQLESGLSVQAALRFFEQKTLQAIGRSIDYFQDHNQGIIVEQGRYDFFPDRGFVKNDKGRYSGAQIGSVANQSYAVSGALSLARECQQTQIDAVLGEGVIQSRLWPRSFFRVRKD